MEEDFVLVMFVGAVALTAFALYLFFRRFQVHKRTTYRALRLVSGNLVVLLFLGSLFVLAGEVHYRFFYDTTESFGLTKTTHDWLRRHFQFNNASFRDSVPYAIPLSPDRRRVTFVGDSFTAGHGVRDVEDRFVNRIRRNRSEWDVQMLARCGWDTGHEIAYVEESVQFGYELDVVVLIYCLNDVADIVPEWSATLDRIYQSSERGFLVSHSYLFNTMYFRWKASHDKDVADYYRFVAENYEGPVWDEQRQRLTRLRDNVEARNGRLLVVTFPFVHALGEQYPYGRIHDRLGALWESLSVPHLDLLDELQSHDAQTLVVGSHDAHPNERAHALAARAIEAFLDQELRDDSSNAP